MKLQPKNNAADPPIDTFDKEKKRKVLKNE